MNDYRRAQSITDTSRAARVGRVVSKSKGKYLIELADGRQINGVGSQSNFTFETDAWVTFSMLQGRLMILCQAPHSA